ncbi:hypothetical protein Bpfe_001656 [Biomphalaria pfeifferi]|uniref:G-protein coupled receptors family 1 profile domain-containing protein n=1 Tax=Biomphalaria pfeifferi TaxID=112525 RepID=A0AAD8CA85_BIOPF|nr:hypothetical protein Bpfe_001656 [Biomphalaria pfeifferi]
MTTQEAMMTTAATQPLWNTTKATYGIGNTTEDYEYSDEMGGSISLEDGLPTLLTFSLTLVVGLIGNSLVIFSIAYYRRMRTTTNVFLFSLATADLLLVMVCVPIKVRRQPQSSHLS